MTRRAKKSQAPRKPWKVEGEPSFEARLRAFAILIGEPLPPGALVVPPPAPKEADRREEEDRGRRKQKKGGVK